MEARAIIKRSIEKSRGRSFKENHWGERHAGAFTASLVAPRVSPGTPIPEAQPIVLLTMGWAMLADQIRESGRTVDGCHFTWPIWEAIGEHLISLLNLECRPLDCGVMDELIRDIIENENTEGEADG